MFLIKKTCTAHALHGLTLFSAEEFLMILDNSYSENSCFILLLYFVHFEKHRQAIKISINEF